MYPFFETIRYNNGVLENLSFHQQRVDRTFAEHGASTNLQLLTIPLTESTAQIITPDLVYKCRVKYNLAGEYSIDLLPYTLRAIKSFSFTEIGVHTYAYKYWNRDWINEALSKSGTDEIIFVDNGLIKDASYANLALFDGVNWFTPTIPLLLGTRRAALIEQGIISESEIKVADLHQYKLVKFINAMMDWAESPTLTIN